MADHLGLAQLGDVGVAEVELAQHLLGVLAALGRCGDQAAGRARQLHGLVEQVQGAALVRGLDMPDHIEVLDLGIGEHLVHGVDRPARNLGSAHALHPFGAGAVRQIALDLDVQRVAVLGAGRRRRVVGMLEQCFGADRTAQALPHGAAGGGDIDVSVLGLEHAGRDAGRMVVAGLARARGLR